MKIPSARIPMVLGVLAACFGPSAAADAKPESREAAATAYRQILADQQVPADWTGSTETCTRGTESEASIAASLSTLNILRDFAGLAPVTTDPVYNRRALTAALMMHANNALEHTPPTTWKCYTQEGADAAERSNLSGYSPGATSVAEFIDDDGDLGHRRSLLDPALSVVGTGSTHVRKANRDEEQGFHALYGGPERATTPIPPVVPWPPSGHVPWPLIDEGDDEDDDRWSASFTNPDIDLTKASVAVTFDGNQRTVTDVEKLDSGYGEGEALGWRVPLTAADRAAARLIQVSITAPVNGEPRRLTYSIDAFPLDGPPSPPQPQPQTRVPADLSLRALKVKRRRLIGRLGITSLANGDALTLKLRVKGRRATFTLPIAAGQAAFRIPLKAAERRARIRMVFSYAGSDTVEPATLRRKLTR